MEILVITFKTLTDLVISPNTCLRKLVVVSCDQTETKLMSRSTCLKLPVQKLGQLAQSEYFYRLSPRQSAGSYP
jgi:hypothetical protein